MHETAHTEVTLKPNSFLSVKTTNNGKQPKENVF